MVAIFSSRRSRTTAARSSVVSGPLGSLFSSIRPLHPYANGFPLKALSNPY
jgi:hypothetical protein